MAESVVSFVVERLGHLLINEAKFLSSVANQVEQIQAELKRMQCFLKDVDARQDEDETVRNWVAEIREIALDVQDVLETYAFRVSSRKDEGILRRCHGIKTMREGESSNSANEKLLRLRRSYSHVVDEDFVGLEGDVEHLVAHLVNEGMDNCHRVLCIFGMGGLGKTTIAKRVYHHDSVQRHFDALAWVCISQKWQRTDILQGILIKLIPQERDRIMTLREEELMKQLYEVQLNKKCLVVLDDIWSVDVWDFLGAAFPNTEMCSKILLTTRNKDVAVYKDPSCFLHEPRCLTEEESWELFQRKAFPKQKGLRVDTDINKLGREMVGHCGGLTLAIVALGGILVTKCTLSEWKKVHQTVHDYLRRGKSHGQHHISVYEVLALSYKDLPYQLKPCFLYLGNFTEDSMIPTRTIYQMWAAEGFLPIGSHEGEQEETLADVAERYLDEFVQRCMVQVQMVQVGG